MAESESPLFSWIVFKTLSRKARTLRHPDNLVAAHLSLINAASSVISPQSIVQRSCHLLSAGLLLGLSLLGGCTAEDSGYQRVQTGAEDGTGRAYMGREIADVMTSEHGALWLDRPQRDEEELPQRLLRALQLNASDVVADIGSGTGFFTVRLARLVPSGRVYAVEVQEALVDTIRVRAERQGLRNVTPVLGGVSDPALPENRLDLALIVSSYHEFAFPREMLEKLEYAIKPGGRLVLVEYRAEDETIPIAALHRMSEAQIIREGEAAGLQYRETLDVLPQQHIVVFTVPIEER